jgi:hypothetical protein
MPSPRSSARARVTAVVVAVSAAACVDAPFARINVADPGSSARVVLLGLPDSLHSRGAVAAVEALVEGGQLPRRVAGLTVRASLESPISGFQQWLVQTGATEFQVGSDASLIPREVVVYALAAPTNPRRLAQQTVVVWQRPYSVDLACLAAGCASMPGVGSISTLSLTMRDSLAWLVNPGNGATRYGEIVSRSPEIVEVVDRPSTNTVRVRGVAGGTAWIVFTAPRIADSLAVSVFP